MDNVGLIGKLAELVGSPEPALRLLLSLVLGYPIAFFHRNFLHGKSPTIQHLYFIICGLSLGYFNYGWDVLHSFSSITVSYLILKILGGGLYSLLTVFTYTMAHLLIGYWVTATRSYDIMWTMPHCVLTLRLIGLAFNVYDGQEKSENLSAENKKTALLEVPSVLEVFAHSYFPSSFLIGPQFPLRKLRDFVELRLEEKHDQSQLPDSVQPGLLRLSLGLLYLLIFQIGGLYITDDLIVSKEFSEFCWFKQFFVLGLWGRFALYKYIACWLVAEGSLIVIGLTYNGKDQNGKTKWDGCSNVKLRVFENATKMDHYIDSFNINTNHWVAQYIYKRLKFLNNKVYSQLGTLLFLAIWHGFHSGYYATFFFEFITILAEKALIGMLEKNQVIWKVLYSTYVYPVTYIFLRIYTLFCMGYAMIPFILLKNEKYIPLYKRYYFSFHILFFLIIFGAPLIKKYIIRPQRVNREGNPNSNQDSTRSKAD